MQETLPARVARRATSFDGGAGFRAWLYRIATNACLDAIRRARGAWPSLGSFAEVPWLQPYPDRLLDEVAPSDAEPDAVVVARETIELTFLAVIQLLPAAPARRADPARRARLVGRRDRGAARDERRRRQQRAAARPRDAARAAAGAPRGRPRAPRRPHAGGARAAAAASSTPTSAATPRPPPRCCARTSASRCRRTRWSTTASTRSAAADRARRSDRATIGEWRLVPTRANRHAGRRELPARARATPVYRAFKLDVLRDRGRRDRRDHDVRLRPLRGLRPGRDALIRPRRRRSARPRRAALRLGIGDVIEHLAQTVEDGGRREQLVLAELGSARRQSGSKRARRPPRAPRRAR